MKSLNPFGRRVQTRAGTLGAVALGAFLLAGCDGEQPVVTQPVALPADNPMRYPIRLWDERVEGETVLLVHVSERGEVDSTIVHTSSGYGAFDSAAILGARQLRFTPGKRGDRYVPMWARMPVKFALDSVAAAATAAPDTTPVSTSDSTQQ